MGYFADAQYDVKSPIVGIADTSPTRRTRPFCRYRDISPVSSGESTPKEEARFAFGNAYPEGGSKVRFYCLYERSEVISREGEFTNGRITVSLRAAGAAIPLNNRKGNNTVVSVVIAPLKKAQRKSEGGQLFPESVFPLRASPFPKTPQKPPTPLIFKGVSVI